jgi:predicted dehydrogenase
VTWDLAPHDISIILYVLGEAPTGVNCQGKAHLTAGIEDVTNMTLSFANGAFALVHNSWLDPNKVRQMTFVGKRRMLAYDDIEPFEKIRIYDKRVETPPHYDTFAEFHFSYHYGDMYSPYVKQTESLSLECRHFADCIQTRVCPESNGLEGLRVVQVLEAASQSLRTGGGRVELAPIRREAHRPGPVLTFIR